MHWSGGEILKAPRSFSEIDRLDAAQRI